MPEGRPFPYKFFPRRGVALSVTFGSPIPQSSLKTARRIHEELPLIENEDALPLTGEREAHERDSGMRSKEGWLGGSVGNREREEEARIRSAVTAVVHREVEALGRRVAQAT